MKHGRPVQVGEAWTDGAGAWTVTSFRRTGKGSPRASANGGRRVEQGVPVKISWPGSEMLALDTTTVHDDWGWHNVLLGSAPFADEEDSQLLGGRLLGVYRCPYKLGGDERMHWVGFNDTDQLLGWLEEALDVGSTEVPLPLLEQVVPARLRFDGGSRLNRITPRLPEYAMKTYQVSAPLATHWRKASCAEVECEGHRFGWVTLIDERGIESAETVETTQVHVHKMRALADRDAQRAYYIRHLSGRSFLESKDSSGATVFDFAPGQDCFNEHQVRVERPELFEVRGGDWRGNPRREQMTHNRPGFWVEDFAEHQNRLATRLDRG